MRILLALLICAACFAGPKPSEVLHIVNENSTLDSDENGVYDFQDCLLWWYTLYHDTTNVLRIKTSIDYNDADQPQSIHWDMFSIDFDTSARWGNNATVSLAGGNEYILDEICTWYEADSARRWGYVKYPILWMGNPYALRGNASLGTTPGSWTDTTLYKPLSAAVMLFTRPGCDAAQSDALTNWISRTFSTSLWDKASSKRQVFFDPGADYLYGGLTVGSGYDTLALWVLPTVIEADSVTYLRRALSKSVESPIVNGNAKSRAWYVVDETESPSTDNLYSTVSAASATYRNNVARLFGTRVLCDADSVSSADRETEFVGWTGNVNLRSGDSCLVFFNSGDTHTPTPDSSENWYRQLTFKIATGALTWGSESFFGYSTRGYLRPTGTATQSATADAFKVGFTYVLAQKNEPTSNGLVNDIALGHCLTQAGLPFAVLAYASVYGSYCEFVPMGNPIGVLHKRKLTESWDNWSKW